jgi:predicted TIM-barrel fold metal-dependent hydrolase/quinol monooxygenase YgiN
MNRHLPGELTYPGRWMGHKFKNMKIKCLLIASLMSVTGFAQALIDVHSHIITPEFVSALEQEGRLMDEGFPLPKYDVERHLKWMDEAGVQTSVLTLAAPQPNSALVVRKTNEAAARIKREHPGRYLFCAALPLPDVDAAIREVKYALDTLGADGIELATNVQGQYLGAPELDTLFSVLNERQAVVILHPHRPEPVNREVMAQTPLAMQEYLSETTRAVTNMISRNVLARYPNVKVVVPHCGAYLPLAVPRMKSLAPVMQANKLVGDIDWEANLSALYYDLAGAHSPEVIRMMLTITTPDHLLYGSDYPYVAPQVLTQGLARMKQYLTTEPDLAPYKEMIFWQNAKWLFGQKDEKPSANKQDVNSMLVRIAEIEVFPQYLEEYLAFANEVDRLSVEREPGVVCLFPMQSAENPSLIRILEIYASEKAYQSHLKTDHFQKYKQGTLHMVKDLKLPAMNPLDPEMMKMIFKKQR